MLTAAAALMDFAGDQLFASAGFAQNQHGGVGGRHHFDLPEQLLACRRSGR